MRNVPFWFPGVILLIALSGTLSGAPPVPTDYDKKIDALIATLASPNEKPPIDEDDVPIYPPGYDHKAQDRVLAARDALFSEGIRAFPRLIRHADDRRYSYTEQLEKTLWLNQERRAGVLSNYQRKFRCG